MNSYVEDTVRRALKAYKVEQGMSAESAQQWSDSNFANGLAQVNAIFAQHPRDMESGFEEAFGALKAWAITTT